MKVVAIVGMAGSGKSEVSRVFEQHEFAKVRFGDITDEELQRRNLERNEASERLIRETLRKELGMAAYAKLLIPGIDRLLEKSNVVADGLYSWDEYKLFKAHFGDNFVVMAVYASPRIRYERLARRAVRPLKQDEAVSRDISEIENTDKGGPIAVADFTIVNESSVEYLRKETERIISIICR